MATFPPPENSGPANANPYAPPEAPLADLEPLVLGGDLAEAEASREAYLSHEATIKAIAAFHLLAAILGFLGAFAALSVLLVWTPASSAAVQILVVLLAVFLVLGFLHLALGIGLNDLRRWARWADVVLLSITLASLAVGVVLLAILNITIGKRLESLPLIGIFGLIGLLLSYILSLLLSKKGAMVFSREYQVIIERTPHLRPRLRWFVLFLLLIVLTIGLLFVGGSVRAIVERPGDPFH